MKRIATILFVSILLAAACAAQTRMDSIRAGSRPAMSYMDSLETGKIPSIDQDRRISILVGYNFWNYHYAELGLSVDQHGRAWVEPQSWACFISTEARIDRDILLAPKIGAWIGNGMAIGLNFLYYTTFSDASLRMRPEVGIGLGPCKLVYGYNIPITNRRMEGVNYSSISIVALLGLKTIKHVQRYFKGIRPAATN